jgi:hypothetical protein
METKSPLSSDGGNKSLLSLSSSDGNIFFCDSNVEHCYLNLPAGMVKDIPFDLEDIKEKQDEDNDLSQSVTRHPTWYSRKKINDVNGILYYTKPGDNAANWKIALPRDLIRPTIMWYHQVTRHPGSKRLYQHIHQQYYNRDLHRLVDTISTATIAKEINYMAKDTDSYQNVKSG